MVSSSKELEYSRLYRREKRTKVYESNNRYRRNLKIEMVEAYGGSCTCCGETEIVFLTLEHKNGDGAVHRKQHNNSIVSMLRKIKREGWPTDKYTVLCMNCNFAGRYGKICPHKEKQNVQNFVEAVA